MAWVQTNAQRYVCWPALEALEQPRYLYYEIIQGAQAYFQRHGHPPQLSMPASLLEWAAQFLKQHAGPRRAVTVNLRRNTRFHQYRNAQPEAWLAFFQQCARQYPVTFLLLGEAHEIDERFRDLPNVVVTKDHATTVDQDFALIQLAHFHMGSASGPIAFAFFRPTPYLIVNAQDVLPHLALYQGALTTDEEWGLKFAFAFAQQRLSTEPETAPFLMAQFEAMWAAVDHTRPPSTAAEQAELPAPVPAQPAAPPPARIRAALVGLANQTQLGYRLQIESERGQLYEYKRQLDWTDWRDENVTPPDGSPPVRVTLAGLRRTLLKGYNFPAASAAYQAAQRAGQPPAVAFTVRNGDTLGGGTLMLFRLANWLVELGLPVTVYSEAPPPAWVNFTGRHVQIVPDHERYPAIREPIIIVYSVFELPGVLQMIDTRGRKIYHLCQGVESYHLFDPSETGLNIALPLLDMLHDLPVGRLVVSPHLETYFRERFQQPSLPIFNGIDQRQFTARPQPPAYADHIVVVTSGDPRQALKRIAVVKQAVSQLAQQRPQTRFELIDVVGAATAPADAPDPLPANLDYRLVTQLDAGEMRAVYDRAHVLVNASWYEGFGLPSLEAMACGVPVVQAANFGLDQIAEDGVNCRLLPQASAEAITAALAEILDQPALRERLIAGGLATAQRFTLAQQHARFCAAFADILGQPLDPARVAQQHARLTAAEPAPASPRAALAALPAQPLFSVLVPTYNQAQYLPAALESLRAQTYENWEALVVNDGSTDDTAAVLEDWARRESRLRIITKPNGGTASALNEGVRNARGEWLCWLSSDDLFQSDKLAIHVRALNAQPEIRFFHTDFFVLDEQAGVKLFSGINPATYIPPVESQLLRFFQYNYINGITIAVHRSVMETVGGFNPSLRHGQDYEMWLRISARYRSAFLPARGSVTRVYPTQASLVHTEVGILDSARAAVAFLNARPFPALFPALDLTEPDAIGRAVRETLNVASQPEAFVNQAGFGQALIRRLLEWMTQTCPRRWRAQLIEQYNTVAQSIQQAPVTTEVKRAFVSLRPTQVIRYEAVDPLADMARHGDLLHTEGRSVDAANLRRYLARLQPAAAAAPAPAPTAGPAAPVSVSVIVIGGGGPAASQTALARQTHPAAQLEVITSGGTPAALNQAIRRAHNDLLIFLSAEALAAPDLAAQHVAAHQRLGAGAWAVMGTYDLAEVSAGAPLTQALSQADLLYPYSQLQAGRPVEAGQLRLHNLSVPRATLQTVGLLDEAFDALPGAEAELGYRFQQAGGQIIYSEACRAAGTRPVTLAEFSRRQLQAGRGAVLTALKQPALAERVTGQPRVDILEPLAGQWLTAHTEAAVKARASLLQLEALAHQQPEARAAITKEMLKHLQPVTQFWRMHGLLEGLARYQAPARPAAGPLRFTLYSPGTGLAGGIKILFEYANRLAQRGHQVAVFAPHNRPPTWFALDPRVQLVMPTVGADLLASSVPDADVIVGSYWPTLYQIARLPASKGHKVYLIQGYEAEALATPEAVDPTYHLPLQRIAVSHWLQSILNDRYQETCAVVPNCYDKTLFYPEPALRRRSPAGDLRIGMLYHPEARKGGADGASAFQHVRAQLPQARLIYLSAAPPAEKIGDECHVGLSGAALRAYYNSLDIFVSPSWSEGFGLPGLEALACGVPLVTTDSGGVREYARHEATALVVPPRDPDALAHAILRLAREPELRRRLREAGLQQAAQFDWDRSVDQFEALIREQLAQPAAPRLSLAPAAQPSAPPLSQPAAGGPAFYLTGEVSDLRLQQAAAALNQRGVAAACYQSFMPQHLAEHSVFIFSRPHLNAGFSLGVRACAAAGRPVVIDLDDNFHHLPADHPGYASVGPGNPALLQSLEQLLQHAAVLTVATPALAEFYGRWARRVAVVPNGWSRSNPLWLQPSPARASINLGWAGTMTHRQDVLEMRAAVLRILREFPQTRLVIGGDPEVAKLFHAAKPAQVQFLPGVPYADYPGLLAHFDILLAPLRANDFNQAKSDIKLVEAGARRIPWVASQVAAYAAWPAGGLLVKKAGEWYQHLKRLVADAGLRTSLGQAGHAQALTREAQALAPLWLEILAAVQPADTGPEPAAPASAAARLEALLAADDLAAALDEKRVPLDAELLALVHANARAAQTEGQLELADGLAALAAEISGRLAGSPAPAAVIVDALAEHAIAPRAVATLEKLLSRPDLPAALQEYAADLDADLLALVRLNAQTARADGSPALAAGLDTLAAYIAGHLAAAPPPAPAETLRALLEADDIAAALELHASRLDQALLDLVRANAEAARAEADLDLADGLHSLAEHIAGRLTDPALALAA
ncbi:MAG: glycosyltransferase [Anaerolineales bacterium]|nr:glycosyltransferase [Anaerolineales bacterium]